MNDTKSHLRLRDVVRHGLHLDDEATLSEQDRIARRRRRVENLILFCWGLIVLKCFVVVWLVNHFAMPFDPMWVILPTVSAAFIATSLYFWLRD